MTIQTFSPIKDSGNYYLNVDNFESRLMFTDSHTKINYVITRYDYTDQVWKIINNGVLQGYNKNSTYQYKVDLEQYIKINQIKDLNGNILDTENIKVIDQYNDCKLSIAFSVNNILSASSAYLTYKSNGEIWLKGTPGTSIISSLARYDYVFYDKINSESYILPSCEFLYKTTWIPFTVYSNNQDSDFVCYDENNNQLFYKFISPGTQTLTKTYLIYIPSNCYKIRLFIKSTYIFLYPKDLPCNTHPFYFNGINGGLDIIYTNGNIHNVENVTKDYIQLNNQKLPIKINVQKQLKVNTGFKLNDEQVYSLIKSPYLLKPYNGELESTKRNLLKHSNIPIIKTTTDGKYLIGNYEFEHTLVMGKKYTALINLTSWNGGNCYFYLDGNQLIGGSGSEDTIKIITFVANANWERLTFYQADATDGDIVVRYATVYEGNSVPNNGIEYGGNGWIPAYGELPIDGRIIQGKKYMLDTTTFEGWNGNNLSEKNIELLLTDDKNYKRRTNFDSSFWD